ncbi:MAG TPA: hypothetical protein VFW96_11965 [Thermomicrobiales bacterium]|nr:hypothetical protein [Thermomicrobiales bacterium]
MSEPAGQAGASERERQRAGLAWALADLDGLRARGVVDATVYAALRRDYEARLAWLDAPLARTAAAEPARANGVDTPAADAPPLPPPSWGGELETGVVGAAAGGGAATYVAPDSAPEREAALHDTPVISSPQDGGAGGAGATPARAAGGGFADAWVNILLYLGAFFVVMAAVIFVAYSWRSLGGPAKAGLMLGFTAAFLGAGALCLRLPRVRLAGHTFLAIGALLTPLDIVALYTFVLRGQGLTASAVWAWGSLYCALFYGALAARRLGRAYAVAAVLAAVSAWVGALAALNPPEAWWPPALLALPVALLGAGRLAERAARGRATFGAVPAVVAQGLAPLGVAAQCLAPLGVAATGVYILADGDRAGGAAALGLAVAFYLLAATTRPADTLRDLEVAAALATGSLFALALGYAVHLPPRGYAALALGLAWGELALAALAARRGARQGTAALLAAFAWLHAGLLLAPWGFVVRDRYPAYWAAIFAGLLLFMLAGLWRRRSPWLVYPAMLAAALTLFHALRLGAGAAATVAPLAWAYAGLALAPLAALGLLRQRGAARDWDVHLVAVGQLVALGAAVLAAGDRAQLAAMLWLFAAAGVATVALLRRAEWLALPSLWALAAVGATLAAAGVERRWAPAVYAGIGAAGALGLQGWRGMLAERRTAWFAAHRWLAGGWAALGPLLGLALLDVALGRFLTSGELRNLVLDPAYGPVGLATALCAAAFTLDAVVTLRRPTGYGASAVFALAVLLGIARVTPNNPQAYAVPLGLYLLALSVYVAYERDLGPVRMPVANGLLAAAICVILGTTLAQSLVHPWRYVFLGLAEGLALLGATLFLRRRYGVLLALVFLVLTTLRALFDAARSLPYWAALGLLGLALLAGGLFVLLRRDRFDAWGAAAASRWSRLM